MEEKNKSIVIIVVLIIAILMMGFFMYRVCKEKNELSANVSKIENKQEFNSTSISFEKLMDMIYPHKFSIDSQEYVVDAVSDMVGQVENIIYSGELEVSNCQVCAYFDLNSLDMHISDSKINKNNSYSIKGVEGEIVSIIIDTYEAEIIPEYIYILTRDGNVYYVKNNKSDIKLLLNLNNLDFEAKKIENLSNIVSISVVSTIDDGTGEGYTTVVATNYNGEYILLKDYTN